MSFLNDFNSDFNSDFFSFSLYDNLFNSFFFSSISLLTCLTNFAFCEFSIFESKQSLITLGNNLAGCPILTKSKSNLKFLSFLSLLKIFLYLINFSPILSTAILLGATTSILLPNLTNCNIISTIVVVFPVPGGP